MALSVVDLYRDVLPKTNCGDCGFPTCLAFAGMVVTLVPRFRTRPLAMRYHPKNATTALGGT